MRRCLEADDLVEFLASSEKVIKIAVPGPARDPGVREALVQLAQAIAHPTEKTLEAVHHLVKYFTTYPSGMILRTHDTSYLSDSNAGSRLGALEYLRGYRVTRTSPRPTAS